MGLKDDVLGVKFWLIFYWLIWPNVMSWWYKNKLFKLEETTTDCKRGRMSVKGKVAYLSAVVQNQEQVPLNSGTHIFHFSSAPPHKQHSRSSPGFKAISGVCGGSLRVNLGLPSELLIHLPKMTVSDLSAKQSICVSFAFSSALDVKNIMKKCQRERNNRAVRQSAFDLGGHLIHLPICLNYFSWSGSKTT